MNFIEFSKAFRPFSLFSITDIRKRYPRFDSRRLVEWQQKGYVQKIINSWYRFADEKFDQPYLYLVANEIYAPSYVSFESALAFHGLIPETVITTTSATSRKTKIFHIPLGTFSYRRIKPALLFGYLFVQTDGRFYKIAEPEKAILDYLYLHPKMKSDADFEAWRINRDWMENDLDREKLLVYLSMFSNDALSNRVTKLLKFIDYANT